MHFEDLLSEIGSFGLYQRLLCFLLIPTTTGIVAFTYYFQLFILTAPPYTCRQGGAGGGGTGGEVHHRLLELLNATPYNDEARLPYACHQHDPNASLFLNASGLSLLQQLPAPEQPCGSGWDYDYSHFFSSYTSERDWVCEEAWRPYLVVTIFWVGNTVGSWLWGVVSDTKGRRVAILGSLLIYGVAGATSVLATNFYLFAALRFLTGTAHHTVTHLPFVLVVEYCGLKARVVPLLTIMMTYTIGSVAAPALAWLLWDWTALTLLASIPALALLLSFRWLPESASWLITRGQKETARAQLEVVAKVNKRHLPEETLALILSGPEGCEGVAMTTDGKAEEGRLKRSSNRSILQAFRYPRLRLNILLVLLVWMMACMCYYGHCQNTANLGSGVLMSYLLGAVVEVPAWCVPWLIHRLGRRLPLAAAFLISAAAGFSYALVPADLEWVMLAVALVGRATITGAYYITLQYGPEVFPTVVRGQGVALSETLGGAAIFISPLIVYLGEFERTAPLLVFAGLSALAGGATLLLPETGGLALPQTLPQAEDFSRQQTPACCRSRTSGKAAQARREEDATDGQL